MNVGIQRAFGVVTHGGDVRILCSLGHGGSSHLNFHFALNFSLILLCQDVFFLIMRHSDSSGLPEYGHQIY